MYKRKANYAIRSLHYFINRSRFELMKYTYILVGNILLFQNLSKGAIEYQYKIIKNCSIISLVPVQNSTSKFNWRSIGRVPIIFFLIIITSGKTTKH